MFLPALLFTCFISFLYSVILTHSLSLHVSYGTGFSDFRTSRNTSSIIYFPSLSVLWNPRKVSQDAGPDVRAGVYFFTSNFKGLFRRSLSLSLSTKQKTIINQMTRKRSTDGNNVSRVRLSSDAKVADEYERKTARGKET